ncbi:hypothetical protein [Candidatus Viadribacter manganicus]|uniref:Uncharacterized protein n=1 Tax=Candidatus Viadribacter manganicus TaxID=1759059 RepID=A0A1B1ALY7_9PROT|nr:hypothetical protein [Candidatus Viadribacter manganicus]ANP47551.1 hypothetical protein ATE48_17395 [Candidatus Viadribacter manganicus]
MYSFWAIAWPLVTFPGRLGRSIAAAHHAASAKAQFRRLKTLVLIDGPTAQPPTEPSDDNGGNPEREENVACPSYPLLARFSLDTTIEQPIFPVSKQTVGVNKTPAQSEEARADEGD